MATYNTTSIYFADTNAEFQALIAIVRAALTACGWAQTADTGQINPATAAIPGSNAQAGFEIWYMNDSLHATSPIYMRIGYGRTTTLGSFSIFVSFSMTGTNGAGVLMGSKISESQYVLSRNPSTRLVSDATLYSIYASGAAGRFGLAWMIDAAATPFGTYFHVERFRNSDGTPNGNGFWIYLNSSRDGASTSLFGAQFVKGQFYDSAGQSYNDGESVANLLVARVGGGGAGMGPSLRARNDPMSTLRASKVWAFPFYPPVAGEKYPFTGVLVGSMHDFPVDIATTLNLTLYGAAKAYKPLGVYMNNPFHIANATCPQMLLMQYE